MNSTTAHDIMTTELITIRENATVETALKALINNKITGLPVVDAEGKMVGVLSEYDLIQQISNQPKLNPEIFQEKIKFSGKPFSLPSTAGLEDIVKHFVGAKYRRIPILDKNQRLVGIITRRDIMKLFFYRAKFQ